MGLLFAKMPALFKNLIDMIPILPRELLWTDKKTMDWFFNKEPICVEFYDVYFYLKDEPFNNHADFLRLYNEVFYQITRVLYEHPMPQDLPRYVVDIKANLGWNYSSELVMTILYFFLELIKQKDIEVKLFLKSIHQRFSNCIYWFPFESCCLNLRREKIKVSYSFKPNPVDPYKLCYSYVDWNKITNNYDFSCIEQVINLYDDVASKGIVAEVILGSLKKSAETKRSADDSKIVWFLNRTIEEGNDYKQDVWLCSEPMASIIETEKELHKVSNEKSALECRVAELETEIEKLKSFKAVSVNTKHSQDLNFSLSLIVDYCKKKHMWEDVKEIVAMLNKLTRGIQLDEENIELIDSIEEEFKHRGYGNTIYNAPVGQVMQHVDRVESK